MQLTGYARTAYCGIALEGQLGCPPAFLGSFVFGFLGLLPATYCKRAASHVEEETVKAAYKVTTPATTEKEGEGTYTATFENEAFETQTKTESIDKLPVKPQKPAKPKDDKPSKSDKTNKQTLPGTGDSTANVIMAMLSMTAICFAGSAIASKMRK